jgi:hypothetical protein
MKASEARQLSNDYVEPLESVLKWISQRAREGNSFTFAKISPETAAHLKENGYELKKNQGLNDYLIQW